MKYENLTKKLILCVLAIVLIPITVFSQVKKYPTQIGYDTYWGQRHTQFAALGLQSSDIVMLGDDFIDRGMWTEFFGNQFVKNRGIAGDVIEGVSYRLEDVVKDKPAKIFLYIGKRDIKLGTSPQLASERILEVIDNILKASKRTKVYFISIIPDTESTPDMLAKYALYNDYVKKAATTFTYVDITDAMVSSDSTLNPLYSYNKTSTLNGRGYYAVCQALSPYICAPVMEADGVRDDYPLVGFIKERNSIMEYLPAYTSDILMIGNSITNIGEWTEFLHDKNVKNRGISGDMTAGVLTRLPHMLRVEPRAVFLMIGINDLGAGKTKEYVLENILEIVKKIKELSPRTPIYVESILPTNPTFSSFKTHTGHNAEVVFINDELKKMAASHGYTFINIHHALKDSDGNLSSKYTNDGLHLCWDGYRVWRDILISYMPK
ncbi:MAG: GDSL-type esterase/lipase family protein [Flavobacteriales bacterium]|nr:GDSL-type esterase/lipase family protein [Flavobacteriales bacterium]